MFWNKVKQVDYEWSEQYNKLAQKFENLRIELEGVKIELALYKQKLHKKAGIKLKDELEEEENNKAPQVLLTPGGSIPKWKLCISALKRN